MLKDQKTNHTATYFCMKRNPKARLRGLESLPPECVGNAYVFLQLDSFRAQGEENA